MHIPYLGPVTVELLVTVVADVRVVEAGVVLELAVAVILTVLVTEVLVV
jgi:hypothetical protein